IFQWYMCDRNQKGTEKKIKLKAILKKAKMFSSLKISSQPVLQQLMRAKPFKKKEQMSSGCWQSLHMDCHNPRKILQMSTYLFKRLQILINYWMLYLQMETLQQMKKNNC